MSIKNFKAMLIPAIKAFCNVPIIEADQSGDKPKGPHATFKITSPFIKGVGQAEQRAKFGQSKYELSRVEDFKRVLSFTAYAMDEDESFDLAQQIHDWFEFYGYEFLNNKNVVVIEATAVQNRDVFLFDDYERRNGFDVTLRLTRELVQEAEYIESLKEFGRIDRSYEDGLDAETEQAAAEQDTTYAGETKAGEDSL